MNEQELRTFLGRKGPLGESLRAMADIKDEAAKRAVGKLIEVVVKLAEQELNRGE